MTRSILYAAVGIAILVSLFGAAASAGEPVKIGAILGLTGGAAEEGYRELTGMMLAIEEINERGGLLGRPVEIATFDDKSQAIGAKVAAEEAAKSGVAAIVGPTWSTPSIAAARVAQERRIPLISTFASNPKVTRIGDYIFTANFTDLFQGKVMSAFARQDLGAKTAVVLTDLNSDYSQSLTGEFVHHFQKMGGQMLAASGYRTYEIRFDRLVQLVQKTAPDAIFIPGYQESGRIAKKIRSRGIDAFILGGDGWDTIGFMALGGESLQRSYYCTTWSPEVDTPTSRAFVEKYKTLNPDSSIAQGYDCILLLADAITRAGSVDGAKIRDALAATDGFEGVTGFFHFDENRNPRKRAVIMEIKNGRAQFLKTIEP